MRFDEALGFLNDLTAKEFFTNVKYHECIERRTEFNFSGYQPFDEEKYIRNFVVGVDELKVTKELLRNLDEEYHRLNPSKVATHKKTK